MDAGATPTHSQEVEKKKQDTERTSPARVHNSRRARRRVLRYGGRALPTPRRAEHRRGGGREGERRSGACSPSHRGRRQEPRPPRSVPSPDTLVCSRDLPSHLPKRTRRVVAQPGSDSSGRPRAHLASQHSPPLFYSASSLDVRPGFSPRPPPAGRRRERPRPQHRPAALRQRSGAPPSRASCRTRTGSGGRYPRLPWSAPCTPPW